MTPISVSPPCCVPSFQLPAAVPQVHRLCGADHPVRLHDVRRPVAGGASFLRLCPWCRGGRSPQGKEREGHRIGELFSVPGKLTCEGIG